MKQPLVVIGIPTFKRAIGLRRLLNSISSQVCDFSPTVLVADNEGEDGGGLRLAEQIKDEGYPFDLRVIPVCQRGISSVRNAIMTTAFIELKADLLAMVDDDETVEPKWIASLVDAWRRSSAGVVAGAIRPYFEVEPEDWVKFSPYHSRVIKAEGFLDYVQAAGNILISRSAFERASGNLFSLDYGLTGGEDKEFFMRLKDLGVRFYYTPYAVSYEYYSASRLTRRWALERAFRIGSNDVRILMSRNLGSKLIRAKIIIFSLLSLFYYFFMQLTYSFAGHRLFQYKLKMYRQLGKISSLFGRGIEFYK